MKITLKHIPILTVILAIVLSSCAKEENELIPRKKLAVIYAEMFMTDEWIRDNPDLNDLVDTSLIYEPILEKYGFTSADYRHSVDYYLNDPERFSRIFRTTSEMLDERYHQLKKQKDIRDREKEKEERRELYAVEFPLNHNFPYMGEEPYVKYYDSLAVEYDTLAKAMMIRAVETKDTIYDRLVMIVRTDSLAVADSLHMQDSLSVSDTVRSMKVVEAISLKDSIGNENRILRRSKEIKNMDDLQVKQFQRNQLKKDNGKVK